MLLALSSPVDTPRSPFPPSPHLHHHPLHHATHLQPHLHSPLPPSPHTLQLPLPPLPPPSPAATAAHGHRRRPKLSLTITPETRRTFASRSSSASSLYNPRTPTSAAALSPTSRNTIANARMSSYWACNSSAPEEILDSSSSASSSEEEEESSSGASSSSDDDDFAADDCGVDIQFGGSSEEGSDGKMSDEAAAPLALNHGKKRRKCYYPPTRLAQQQKTKTCAHPTSAAASFLPLTASPSPSPRPRRERKQKVRFVSEVTVVVFEQVSDDEDEPAMTGHERVLEMMRLKRMVEEDLEKERTEGEDAEREGGKMDEGEEDGGGRNSGMAREGENWMRRVAARELAEIEKMELEEEAQRVERETGVMGALSAVTVELRV